MGQSPMRVLFATKLVCLQLSRVLGALVCLLGTWTSGAQSSGIQTSLHGVKGSSILFHLNISSGENIKKITWSFEFRKRNQILFCLENESLKWEDPQKGQEQKVRMMANMTSLSIGNLTFADHGCYTARIQYPNGIFRDESFCLSVKEPIFPKIKVLSSFLTSEWCNLTLACEVMGDTKEVTVAWENGNISTMLTQEESLGLHSNSSILNLSLRRNIQDSSLTCIAKNPAEQKNSTLNPQDACKNSSRLISDFFRQRWLIGLFLLFICLEILGTALFIHWRKKKKGVTDSSKNQGNSDISIKYAVLNPDRPREVQNQCQEACEQQPPERELPTTIYSEIRKIT